jgi:hypothetical protein
MMQEKELVTRHKADVGAHVRRATNCRLQRTYRSRCHSIRSAPPQFLSQIIGDVMQ